jgi:osmoprotectant transport system ATP-binding protein
MSAPGTRAAIRLEGVSKSYGGKAALAPTTLDVEAGRCLVLIGPSGCGKSTLLRLVMGLVSADGGTIRFGDLVLGPATLRDVRRRVGYVIQEGGLFPHLTAGDNVSLQARDLGWEEARVRARVATLAALVHLEPAMMDRHPGQLSGGQRQRVGLMRALMLDPEALLMDEPLGALDPMVRARLQHELREIVRGLGKTVLLVTHDMGEAAFMGDRIVLMRGGAIVQSGSARDLIERPAEPFVGEFIRAQRSLLDGEEARA